MHGWKICSQLPIPLANFPFPFASYTALMLLYPYLLIFDQFCPFLCNAYKNRSQLWWQYFYQIFFPTVRDKRTEASCPQTRMNLSFTNKPDVLSQNLASSLFRNDVCLHPTAGLHKLRPMNPPKGSPSGLY